MAITVIGSVNVDESIFLEEFPKAGETIFSNRSIRSIGGKGFNQALTIQRLKTNLNFISCIGNDANGNLIKQQFKEANIPLDYIKEIEGMSGKATVLIASSSENRIIVDKGSNFELYPSDVLVWQEVIAESEILVSQLEIPAETVVAAFEVARNNHVATILNPAPAAIVNIEMLKNTDILIPNEGELSFILQHLAENGYSGEGIVPLFELGIKVVIVTLGSKGAKIYYQDGEIDCLGAHKVIAVDTTAAGDSFVGTFAHFYLKTNSVKIAVEKANIMGALTVQKEGSGNSIANLEEFEQYEQLLLNHKI